MQIYTSGSAGPSLWVGPLLLGVLFILGGVILIIFPNILQFVLATLLIIAGFGMIGSAIAMRATRRTVYQRVDGGGPTLEE